MEFYVYLWKSTAVLSLFFLVDFFLLKKETLFKQNRYFLLAGVICALVFPLIEFTQVTYIERASTPFNFGDIPITNYNSEEPEPFNWWQLLFYVYMAGVMVMFVRFSVQIIGLMKILNKTKYKDTDGFYHIELHEKISPFSFFKYIAYYLKSYNREELDFIIQHEKIHGRQYHSIDVLLNQFLLIAFWFNPLAWKYQKRILENLEFIADHEVANESNLQQKNYELTLLKVSTNYEAPSLANQFYQSLIKKRIVMLNKKPSQKAVFFKSLIILPLLGFFLWSFNVNEEVEYVQLEETSEKFQEEILTDSIESKSFIKEIKINYDGNTTKEQLNADQKFLKDEFNVIMNFSDVNYNKKNELTSLTIEIKQEKSTSTASSNNGNKPIDRLFINSVETDGQINFYTGKTTHSNNIPKQNRSESNTLTLSKLITNGEKIVLNGNIKNLDELKNNTIKVSNSSEKNGILYIEGKIIPNYTEEMKGSKPMTFIKINEEAKANIIQFSGIKVSSQKHDKFSDQVFIKKAENIHATGSPQENEQIANSIMTSQQKDPLILIDGKEATQEEMKNLEPSLIKSMNILKGENATEKYGEKGKNGVIEITLKTEEEIKNSTTHTNSKKSNTVEISKTKNSLTYKSDLPAPLYLIDGKKVEKEELNELDPSTIKSINVLKDENAIEKYGEEGKNGVVVISLLESKNQADDVWFISKGKNYEDGDYLFVVGNSLIEKEELDKIKADKIKNIRVYTSEDAKKILNIDAKGKKVMEFELYGKNEKDRLLPEDILKQKKYQDLIKNKNLLILVDGKETSRRQLQQLDQTKIKTVFSADGDIAIKKFGEKAKAGVIVINTK